MEVAFALLADSANASSNGKLNILGAFDVIRATRFPAFHPSMVLALSLRATHEDGNRKHTVRIPFIDQDGKQLLELKGEFRIPAIKAGEFRSLPQILELNGLRLPAAGPYRFQVFLSGVEEPYPVVLQVVQATEK